MSEHTPTPWAVDPDYRIGMEWNTHIVLADNPDHRVCFMTSGPEGPINAAFIVKAVNNHDALVKALQSIDDLDEQGRLGQVARDALKSCAVGSPVLTHEKGPGL